MSFEEMYSALNEFVGIPEAMLDLAFRVGGHTKETAEEILFYFTGWHNFEGYLGEFEDEDE